MDTAIRGKKADTLWEGGAKVKSQKSKVDTMLSCRRLYENMQVSSKEPSVKTDQRFGRSEKEREREREMDPVIEGLCGGKGPRL